MIKPEPEPIKLLVIIINYFSAALVKKLVEQLALQSLPNQVSISIICADNSISTDQHQILKSLSASSKIDIELLQNQYNQGFGTAINNSVNDKKFDFLCCINPDVSLFPQALFELLTHAIQHPTEGIWGGLTVDKNLKLDCRHAWQEPTLKNTSAWAFGLKRFIQNTEWQDGYQHMQENLNLPYPVDSVSGCFLLISAPTWQATHGFDTDFFLYSEEIDLCRRARSLGFQPTVVPKSKLHHTPHSTEESVRRIPKIYSAKLVYSNKHHGKPYHVLYRAIISFGALARAIVSLLKGQLNTSCVWYNIALSSLLHKHTNNHTTLKS